MKAVKTKNNALFTRKSMPGRGVKVEMEKNKRRAWPGIEPGTSSK
jgi:hypothetical protein